MAMSPMAHAPPPGHGPIVSTTASTTAALAMGDALAVALLSKRDFEESHFALFHPGGDLGRRLLLTVGEIMHDGKAIPAVSLKTLMKDAIMEISSKRLGMTTVTDKDSGGQGIITDGDLRRGLEKWGEKFFSLKSEDVMTKDPRTIKRDTLAVKAISIMEKYSITSLVVLDSDSRVEGIVHLHDLLKSGIV